MLIIRNIYKRQLSGLVISLVIVINGYGQQDISFSQYSFDKMLINSAYTGSSDWLVASIKNRTQMSDIKGAPVSNIFSFQAPILSKNIGLGAKVIYDKIAVTDFFIATGIFSYHIGFGKGRLSFGLEGGIINSNYNYDNLDRVTYIDPSLPVGNTTATMPDISAAVYYHNDYLYMGLSANHLVISKKSFAGFNQNRFYCQSRSYSLTGGYYYEMSRESVLEPGFLVRYTFGLPVQADINILFTMIDKFSAGLSYRTDQTIIAMARIDITKNLKVQYSYDYRVSSLSRYFHGNHEIGISYGIKLLPPPEKKVIHPRYYF